AVIRERRLGAVSLTEALNEPDPRLPYPLDHLGSAIRRSWDHLAPPSL
ncbi:MAG: MBL fold metallo-hydrolase, partial [Terrabacter sp.]|nr:MBL fold metallo-hydrolase [Terrabacter sp.]